MGQRTAQAHERVKEEILREKASALGRAGERLEAALGAVSALAAAWRSTADPDARARLAAEYEHAWGVAERARLALLIQREAVGLRDQRVVDQHFPRPPRRP